MMMDYQLLVQILDKCSQYFSKQPFLSIDKIVSYVKSNYPEFLEKIKDYNERELIDNIKIAWNYEEENTYSYTINEAITWFKKNIDVNRHSCGCIYKEELESKIILYLCFLDHDSNPLIGNKSRYKVINCKIIDESLRAQFSDKDMVIFQ